MKDNRRFKSSVLLLGRAINSTLIYLEMSSGGGGGGWDETEQDVALELILFRSELSKWVGIPDADSLTTRAKHKTN